MKGQMSLEILITLGVILSFTLPVILLLLSVSQIGYETSSLLQADASASILSDSIDDLYSQGPGAKRLLSLSVPTNTESVRITDNEVIVRLKTSDGFYDGVAPIVADVSPRVLDVGGPFVASIIVDINSGIVEVEVT